MPQNFLYPQRDQPMLMPVDMREWLPEDDLVFVVLDAVAALDLGEFRRRYRADGHGRAAFDPEMMVALLLYGYCQGERSSRVIEKRCVRDVAYRVIAGGLRPDHATIARFRARHEKALGGLFSQVLRLLAAEGMVSLGLLSLDGTKLAGNAAQKANRTLPQIEKMLAEAAAADAAEDARTVATRSRRPRGRWPAGPSGGSGWPGPGTGWRPRTRPAAMRSGPSRRPGTRPRRPGSAAAAALAMSRRANRDGTEPRANITDPDVRVMRNQKGYVAGYNGQLVVTAARSSSARCCPSTPSTAPCCTRCSDTCRGAADRGRDPPEAAHRARRLRVRQRGELRPRRPGQPAAPRAAGQRPRPAPTCGPRKRARHLDRYPATARARRRLQHPRGRDDYKLRARTVEPVFGQLKTCQKLTMMSRRGFTACESEWLLACAAHNLRKLHRHRLDRLTVIRRRLSRPAETEVAQDPRLPALAAIPQIPNLPSTRLCATG